MSNSVFPTNQQGNPSEVLSCAGIQNLNKLIKSWGESDTEQLSGLLAVHGWSVPWKGTGRSGLSSQKHLVGLEHRKPLPNSKQHSSAKNALRTGKHKRAACVCARVCTCAQRDGRI